MKVKVLESGRIYYWIKFVFLNSVFYILQYINVIRQVLKSIFCRYEEISKMVLKNDEIFFFFLLDIKVEWIVFYNKVELY